MRQFAPFATAVAVALLCACATDPMQFRTWEGYRYGAAPLRVAHGVIDSMEAMPDVEAGGGRESVPSAGRKAQRIVVRLAGGGMLVVDDIVAGGLHVGDRVRVVGESVHRM